ncbi:hypothetical protein [Sporomusa sp. KB1]|jgi:hypothetical protein|uniref:hypothetical protein n=1 Tax=Sporomusa sp. KB1 TaxID=943346 RepID=UPI0011A4779F|nr:hypothetical protein [Sporomusa sp. KB1]TWH47472.1 hypothetical protein Salpa_3532 [Sporomusa sp. KB1]
MSTISGIASALSGILTKIADSTNSDSSTQQTSSSSDISSTASTHKKALLDYFESSSNSAGTKTLADYLDASSDDSSNIYSVLAYSCQGKVQSILNQIESKENTDNTSGSTSDASTKTKV